MKTNQKEKPVHFPADLALTLKVVYWLSAPSVRPRKPETFQNRTVKGTSRVCSGLRSHMWWAEAGEAHVQGRESTVASCTHGGQPPCRMGPRALGTGVGDLCRLLCSARWEEVMGTRTQAHLAPPAAQDPGRLGITSTQRHTRHFPRSDREIN